MPGSFDRVMEERRQLVEQIIENMEKGYILPKPQWGVSPFTFQNPVSHAKYHGANMIKLYLYSAANGYTDTRYMTFKQAQSMGWQVKKGEKGIRLEKFIFTKQVEQENPDTGQKEKVMVRLKRPMVNTFVVFNASQIDGIEPMKEMEPLEHNEVLEIADQLIASSECIVREEPQGKAYYRPASDTIVLPPRNVFISQEAFTVTLMHEMVHSTGHPSRLDRPLLSRFGTQKYALEELRAELGAFFMGTDLGIEGSQELLDSHTQYLESWIKVLKDDPNELFRACSDAQKAVERLSDNLERYKEEKMGFVIKGAAKTEQFETLQAWLEDNFADGSVRAFFTAENHAKVIDQMGHVKPVEIHDGKVIDYNRYYQKRIKEYEDLIKDAIDQQKEATEDVSKTYRHNDFQDLNSKFDTAFQSGEEVQRLMNEKTKLRLENLVKTQWDSFLGNDYWIPMEEPRQLSVEYFERPDIKSVILLYQLDEEARQEIIKESSYVDNMQYGLPDKFYLGKVNGHNELILGEEVFDHELYHFSKDATNQYEISCSTLKEVAGHIHDYKDVISLTVDEKHLNHEPRQEVNDFSYEAVSLDKMLQEVKSDLSDLQREVKRSEMIQKTKQEKNRKVKSSR